MLTESAFVVDVGGVGGYTNLLLKMFFQGGFFMSDERETVLNKVQEPVFTAQAMAKMAMCVALISIGGYIAFPTPFSPVMVTATTFALGITALILPPKQAFVAVLVWILLGTVGAPVFSGGQGGIGKLLGPSGGFFLGFLLLDYVGVGADSTGVSIGVSSVGVSSISFSFSTVISAPL